MTKIGTEPSGAGLTLAARTAADLMTPAPACLPATVSVAEALATLTSKGLRAAAVIDEAGRPVGVLSQSDLLIHEAQQKPMPALILSSDAGTKKQPAAAVMRVIDLMTPAVFSVFPDTDARKVVAEFQALKVHHLYVVDKQGSLVGVISTLDVLRALK